MSKVAIASITGLGVAGTGGLGVYYFHSRETKHEIKSIEDKLIAEGFKILDRSKQEHGTTLKTAYNTNKSDFSKVFTTSSTDINESTLKSLCEDSLKKEKDDSSYSKAKRWCVVPVSITQHLSNLGLSPLQTTGNKNRKDGSEMVTEYEKDENFNKRISGLPTLSDQKWEKIRDKCNVFSTKKNYEDRFDTDLESSKTGCVSKSLG